jgi:hypothetical protein
MVILFVARCLAPDFSRNGRSRVSDADGVMSMDVFKLF